MDNGSSYARFLAGDEDAMLEIVKAYRPGLTFFVCGILGDAAAAQDVVQETFLKLCVKRPKDKGGAAFKTWLYAIARNLALDHLRRQKSAPEPLSAGTPSPAPGPEDAQIAKEERVLLYRALAALPEDYAAVINLSYFQGFGIAEIAKILHKSSHNTSALLYRAKAALKAQLEKEGFEP